MADKSTKIKRLRLSRETIIQLDALIAARRIKIHAHLRARVFIMYGVFGIHFLASTTSSFPMSARSSRGGEILVSCSLCSHFSMYRMPNHSAPNQRNICFRCFRILFGYVLLRFPSHFPLLYLALFRRETSGRRPREQRHNSPPTKSAVC